MPPPPRHKESAGPIFESYSSTFVLVEEARFRDHLRIGDGFGDLVVSALFREAWMDVRGSIIPRILPIPEDARHS